MDTDDLMVLADYCGMTVSAEHKRALGVILSPCARLILRTQSRRCEEIELVTGERVIFRYSPFSVKSFAAGKVLAEDVLIPTAALYPCLAGTADPQVLYGIWTESPELTITSAPLNP